MKIHFIRHAQAVTRSALLPDEYRTLTCRGRKRFRKVAASLKKTGFNPDIIITSSRIRAVQTADILAESLLYNRELAIADGLAGEYGLQELEGILSTFQQPKEIAIIGHEPSLGRVVSALLDLSPQCQLSKGSVVSMKITRGKSGLTAELGSVVTGSGKIIDKPGAARKWLEGKACADNRGERWEV